MKVRLVLFGVLFAATVCSAAPVNMIFQGFHTPGLSGWTTGYPYFADIGAMQNVPVMCDDWAHGGFQGQTWLANFTDFGTINAGNIGSSSLRFKQLPNAFTLYQEAAWLLLQTNGASLRSTNINFAVWHTFDKNAPVTAGSQPWLIAAQNEADAGFPGVDFHSVEIYTPVKWDDPNLNNAQEFLRIVPEPGTLLLLAGGIAGIVARKKIH